MRQGFVPLALSSRSPAAQPAAGGKAPAAAPAQPPFQPLTPSAPAASATPAAAGEPIVTVERDGQRITRIVVQCPCGHVIELACG